MKAVAQKTETFRLIMDLTEEEARMLKALFQNHSGAGEPVMAMQIRESIFTALHEAGVKA